MDFTSNTPNQVFPYSDINQYPGMSAFRDALRGYDNMAFGPESKGYQQLTEAANSDPTAQEYQQDTQGTSGALSGGRGVGAQSGLFASLLGGIGAANVAGQHARDVGKAAALKGIGNVGISSADSMASLQDARLQLQNAQTQANLKTAGGINSLLQTATSPGAMKLFSGIGSLFKSTPFDPASLGSFASGVAPAATDFANFGSVEGAEALGGVGSTTAAGGFGDMLGSLADFAPALFAA
jgi:hypothetical protein